MRLRFSRFIFLKKYYIINKIIHWQRLSNGESFSLFLDFQLFEILRVQFFFFFFKFALLMQKHLYQENDINLFYKFF